MSGKTNASLIGGLFAGIAASACCVGPLLLLLLGFSGAWVSHLTALEPYRPILVGLAFIALFMAYLRIYRVKSEQHCEPGKACAMPENTRLYKRLFLGVVMVVMVSIVSPYFIPIIFA